MLKTILVAAAAASLAFTAPAVAQQGPPPGGGAPPAPVTKNPADAPAGVYNLDTGHSAVIARLAHARGVSFSTLRFAATKGVLTWDPANPAAIKLEAAVDAKPHYEPIIYRLPPEGEQLLNAVKFPTITFVSTAVAKTGATKADVTGNLTLLGVTKPVVMHLEVVGVGKTMQGAPVIGFTGTMEVKRSDFGMTFAVGPAGDLVSFTLDGEFVKS